MFKIKNILNCNNINNIKLISYNKKFITSTTTTTSIKDIHSISFDNILTKNHFKGPLSKEDLQHFNEYGYVIKNGVIEDELLTKHQHEVREFISRNAGISFEGLEIGSKEESEHLALEESKLSNISNGFGGMINFYHGKYEYEIRQHQKLYECFVQLYETTFSNGSKLYSDENEWANEYGAFDPRHMYMFINRCGFRIPNLKNESIRHQKGTGLHLDCNPFHLFRGEKVNQDKIIEHVPLRFWQPIQAFVSCSNTLNINQGGFWTVPKFHKKCVEYFKNHPQDNSLHKEVDNSGSVGLKRGNAFDFQDNKYQDVIESLQYIPIKRGDVLFWDWRMPHTNDTVHNGSSVREVVYAAHLPKVPINEQYAELQKNWYFTGKHPNYVTKKFANLETVNYNPPNLTLLGKNLLKINPWSN
ncbi:hypothetical protein DICPUDRAFT_31119 [Dictyostelium purpureum]|uniref:Uncharacterized protein n=1 Tax=Dictyostelium purpureum TaxID=5786 RepID=F0ZGN2_DICPU|nr:uncharacterized protein DICPUDRAFT_31119 [Dictyostelium purpureum]EGC36916.1 hypothetical protein DICPUDRAFT_31119 [Dictyostelium purpureum]|eukprot:XP_003286559.1 hypothetical protein DICPUDRAFT_31119 [Dictyostelium purpureum]